jgi:NAD(P)-dependent dehydrogenase (short-subunit alcohol dehydrogenase family)
MNIEGRIAIVTGAAAGIGRATSVELARAGAKCVVLADIDGVGLAKTKALVENAGTEAMIIETDVTKTTSLRNLYAQTASAWGEINIVFNNAGIVSGPPPYPDTPVETIEAVIAIDLTAVILSTQIAIGYMKETGGGVIVNTASIGGLNPFLADAPYAAAKAGVIMFSQSCESLFEAMNIRVNAICPAVTETAILEKTGGGTVPDWLAPMIETVELLQPEDIAEAVVAIILDDDMAGEVVVIENEPKV